MLSMIRIKGKFNSLPKIFKYYRKANIFITLPMYTINLYTNGEVVIKNKNIRKV